MEKSKKIILFLVLVLTLALSFSLIACKDKNNSEPEEVKVSFMVGGKEASAINIATNGDVAFPDNPVVEGQVFEGWELDNGTPVNAEYFKSNPVTADLVLRARFYYLNDIQCEENLAIKLSDPINVETLGATITSSTGEEVMLGATLVEGEKKAGKTISVKITAEGKYGMTKEKIITGVKVYGIPTITYTAKAAIKESDTVNTAMFNATAKDSFQQPLQITTNIVGTKQASEVITVQISATDAAGNNKMEEVKNIKVYGTPKITYDDTRVAISENDAVNNLLFGTKAEDSFGKPLLVTTELVNGVQIAGSKVRIGMSTIDAVGNANNKTFLIDVDDSLFTGPYLRINDVDEASIDGKYIYFGEYPQTLKLASVTIPNPTTPEPNRYYLGSDGAYYAKVVATPFDTGDLFEDGVTEAVDGETYYFKVEYIKWRILNYDTLAQDGNKAFLLCESIISNMAYDSDSSNYKESEIRAWLIGEFLNKTFSKLQKDLIQKTAVDNSAASTGYEFNDYVCDNTVDEIFLLSYIEAFNPNYGFNERFDISDALKEKKVSDYSLATGAYKYIFGYWYLRSPNNFSDQSVSCIDDDGRFLPNDSITNSEDGVVPALWINLEG